VSASDYQASEGDPKRDTSRLGTQYDRLAGVYNAHLGHFERYALPVLEQLVLQHLPFGARILDLCCGTGQLAATLGQRGYRVTGVDLSERMLWFARRNAPGATLVLADAREFRLTERVDAAISLHDSINHFLSIDDLTAVFTCVRAALCDSGRFAFDVNMEPAFATRWNGCRSFPGVDSDEVCEIRASWETRPGLGCNHVTFRRMGSAGPVEEIAIAERCYSETEIRSALRRAKFTTVRCYEAQRDLGLIQELGRSFFVAAG
jgi:SAM-dependent methyltransferase